MSLFDVFNEIRSNQVLINNFGKKPELQITNINPKLVSYHSNNKFGFWDTSKTIEINQEIKYKEIKPIASKFPFLSDPYLQEKEEIKPLDIKIDLSIFDIPKINFELDSFELEMSKEVSYSIKQLANMLSIKSNRLCDVRNTYDNLVYNHSNFKEIMLLAYMNSHKSKGSNEQIEKWIEKFPNALDRKIKNAEKENRKKNWTKKQREYYESFNNRPSQLRKLQVVRSMNSKGYYGFNQDSIIPKMEKGLTNDEIIEDLIIELRDQFGNDHDMIEFDENKQFQEHYKKYNNGDYEDYER